MKINNITITHPHLIEEWHPYKNGDKKPEEFTYGSGKRIWWICSKNPKHEWEAILIKARRRGCPYCSGKCATLENNLSVLYPQIAEDWHQSKNGDLSPWDVTHGSHKKVWWQCSKNPEHEWEAI
jgi:hypothetical protein